MFLVCQMNTLTVVWSKKDTLFRTLPSVCPHVLMSFLSAAFHAYGKPGKTLVEFRQVLK